MYKVTVEKNHKIIREVNMIDGDSFVFETPRTFLLGVNPILRWRNKRLESANRLLHQLLDEARSEEIYQKAQKFDEIMELANSDTLARDGFEMIDAARKH